MKLTFDTHGNEKQKECCRAWIDPNITDVYYGGAKGGAKSFTGVNLIFGDALTYPDTRYFIARKKLNDLRKFTIPTISKVFQSWGLKADTYTKFNGQDNLYQCYNGSKILLLEAAYMPSDILYERFGSMEFTRGWIEEAGEFESAAKNNLAASIGRWKNDEYNLTRKLLQTGNPSKNYTYRDYYLPFRNGTLKPHQKFIQAFIQDNKMIDKGYLEQLEQSLSPNEKERLLFGNWEYDDDPAALMSFDKICDIFTNTHVPEGKKRITADIARYGGDKIVIIKWNGWRGKMKTYKNQSLSITANLLEQARMELGIGKSDILVDEDGVGGGIVDFYGCKGFVNNSRPIPTGKKDEKGNPIVPNFDNLKSQCYFAMADRINSNGLYLECEDDATRQSIIEELEQVKQKKMDSDMKRGVVPKDKVKEIIGRSPDHSDTIMQNEFFELKPKRQYADASY